MSSRRSPFSCFCSTCCKTCQIPSVTILYTKNIAENIQLIRNHIAACYTSIAPEGQRSKEALSLKHIVANARNTNYSEYIAKGTPRELTLSSILVQNIRRVNDKNNTTVSSRFLPYYERMNKIIQ